MSREKGPLPRFDTIHVQMVLEQIAKHERVSRKQIVKEIGIGEGSVRTILNQLKNQGLITSSKVGHALTLKGKRALEKSQEFIQVKVGKLTVGKVNVATLVKEAASKVKRGIEQRDEAIKAGADGASVLIFKGGRLRFPDGFVKVDLDASKKLIKLLKPEENDVIVIGAASDARIAEAGARAAARTLTRKA